LGHGHWKNYNIPKKVESLSNKTIVEVSCGIHHTVVVDDKDYVYTCGNNQYGQLGIGKVYKDKKDFTFVSEL